jgi:hypothetical protein
MHRKETASSIRIQAVSKSVIRKKRPASMHTENEASIAQKLVRHVQTGIEFTEEIEMAISMSIERS